MKGETVQSYILTFVIGLLLAVCVYFVTENLCLQQEVKALRNAKVGIITVVELQTQLTNMGYYNGDIDGKCYGKTRRAWDRAINDQFAMPYFNPETYKE